MTSMRKYRILKKIPIRHTYCTDKTKIEEDGSMTKAEIKKIETEKKYDFINRVYGTVLGMIPAETRACQKKNPGKYRTSGTQSIYSLPRIWARSVIQDLR